MPKIRTQQFGMLNYDNSAVLNFPAGLPGFEDQTQFVLVERAESAPVVFLQSMKTPHLCFLAAPVNAVDAKYELSITRDDLKVLGLEGKGPFKAGTGVTCMAILSAPENGPLSANLLAPVVVNPRTGIAVQAVRIDSRYSPQFPLAARPSACS
jgi:flagellar assembly factor FliW